jgi:hypothetical protein
MEKRLLTSGACALVLLSGLAHAEELVRLSAYYYADRPAFCFEVPVERVRHLPTWTGRGEPPVSKAQAATIGARTLGLKTAPDRIELNHVHARFNAFDGDVWYYIVEYGPTERTGLAVTAVLFDGKPVPKSESDCGDFIR